MRFQSLFASHLRWMASVWFLALIPLVVGAIGGLWLYETAADVAMQSLGNDFSHRAQEAIDNAENQGRRYEGILTSVSAMANYFKAGGSAMPGSDYLRSIERLAECSQTCRFGVTALDAESNDSQRAAMAHALETHAPFISRDLPLHQPGSAIPQHARLTMYLPTADSDLQQRASPAAQAVPMVYMSLDATDLMPHQSIARLDDVALELFDDAQINAGAVPLFRSVVHSYVAPDHVPLFNSNSPFRFGGKTWTLRLHSLPAFEAGLDLERPQRYLRNMLLLGLLLSIITWLELSTRKRAAGMANSLTSELQKFGRAVDQSPVATVIANVHGDIEYVSAGYAQISGFSAQELIGTQIAVLQPQLATDAERDQLWACIHARKVWKGTLQSRRKNGSLYWQSQTISALTDAQGTLTHLLVTKENITERKKSEESMRRSEAFSVAIMESIGDAIIVLDRSGMVVKVNEAWRRFTDEAGPCPHAAAVHTRVDSNFLALCDGDSYFASPEDASAMLNGIGAVLAGQVPTFQMDYACHTKTGKRWLSLIHI